MPSTELENKVKQVLYDLIQYYADYIEKKKNIFIEYDVLEDYAKDELAEKYNLTEDEIESILYEAVFLGNEVFTVFAIFDDWVGPTMLLLVPTDKKETNEFIDELSYLFKSNYEKNNIVELSEETLSNLIALKYYLEDGENERDDVYKFIADKIREKFPSVDSIVITETIIKSIQESISE